MPEPNQREAIDDSPPPRLGNVGTLLIVLAVALAIFVGLDYWHRHSPSPLRTELALCWKKYAAAADQRAAPVDLFTKAFADFDQTFTPANDAVNSPLPEGETPAQRDDLKKSRSKDEAERKDLEEQYQLLDTCRTWLLSYRQQLVNEQNGSSPSNYLPTTDRHVKACLARHNGELGINDQYNP